MSPADRNALDIQPPVSFAHAGQLPPRFDVFDPRLPGFEPREVRIDLRKCEFVRPAAVAWCLVYLLLARKRGAKCQLLVPSNMGVCIYLKSTGLFGLLSAAGVEVDDRDIREKPDAKLILPLTSFRSAHEAEILTNRAFEQLTSRNDIPAGLAPVVTELFSELVLNAAQHSESEIGSFGCVQFHEFQQGARFTCAVADGGVGVRETLSRNIALRRRVNYDWDALELAVRERVSGTGDPHRGIGLYGVSEDVRRPNRQLLLHSGLGSLEITEDVESLARRTRLFPGTLAFLAIPV